MLVDRVGPNEAGQRKTHKILIIDDSLEDRTLYRNMFEIANDQYQLIEAGTVEEGLRLQESKHPDCVLLDFLLPDSNGMSFLNNFASKGPDDTPAVVMVTGQGDEGTAVNAMKLGAEDYIVKDSLTHDRLAKVIQGAIEKHRLKRQVQRYQDELERSNRELSEFAFTVSHDLKSPLRKIISFCKLLKEEESWPELSECPHYIDRMQININRMQNLIDSLLSYAQALNAQEDKIDTDINALLAEIADDLETYMEENAAKLEIESLPKIAVFPIRIKQLMSNLITNAVKYHGRNNPVITVGSEYRVGEYVFWVKDNGIGIPNHFLDKIFRPFNRLHSPDAIEGVGLGLSICQKAVDKHGGRIWAESKEGEGTTVYFSIPV